tara:strand:- start:22 stop:516 length:495 start_codon:yes stop_codon:yes gene_type:complete
MAVNNKSSFLFYRIVLVLLILILIGDILISLLPGSLSYLTEDHIPAIISTVGIFILLSARINYFSYEDDYEIVHIRSKSLIFGDLEGLGKTRYEFPKRIIQNFDYKETLFQKVLIIHLETQHGSKKIRKFDLKFVSHRKFQYVIDSLKKITNQNKESDDSIINA